MAADFWTAERRSAGIAAVLGPRRAKVSEKLQFVTGTYFQYCKHAGQELFACEGESSVLTFCNFSDIWH